MKSAFRFSAIGVIHSPFKKTEDIAPERLARADGFDDVEGELEISAKYAQGLKDTEGFSHLIVIFVFHKARGAKLRCYPYLDTKLRGVFSTRSPHRPNPTGLTVVKVLGRRGRRLRVSGIDMIEGTPILDIKPYTPRDQKSSLRTGWLKGKLRPG